MNKYDNILRVNAEAKTTKIKNKEYIPVNERVKAYRKLYPEGEIRTKIVELKDGFILMEATVYDENGKLLSNGYAYERENNGYINKTSYIENCETSAVGRALGFLGIGIDDSIASAEEVKNAQVQQENLKQNETLESTQWGGKCKEDNIGSLKRNLNRVFGDDEAAKRKYYAQFGVINASDLTYEKWRVIMLDIEDKPDYVPKEESEKEEVEKLPFDDIMNE